MSAHPTALTADDDDGLGNVILDLGSGRFDALLVFDVSAIDTTSSDESYDIIVQVSNSSTFASGIQEVGRERLGHTSTRKGAVTSTAGRYEIAFANDILGREYRYLRVLTDGAGTSPSITIANMWVTLAAEGIC